MTNHKGKTRRTWFKPRPIALAVSGDGYADIIAGAWKDDNPGTKIIKDAGAVKVMSGAALSL
jgi:hypothetical protein